MPASVPMKLKWPLRSSGNVTAVQYHSLVLPKNMQVLPACLSVSVCLPLFLCVSVSGFPLVLCPSCFVFFPVYLLSPFAPACLYATQSMKCQWLICAPIQSSVHFTCKAAIIFHLQVATHFRCLRQRHLMSAILHGAG